MTQSGRVSWSVIAALSLAASLVTLRGADGTNAIYGCCVDENLTSPSCQDGLPIHACTGNSTFVPDALCLNETTCDIPRYGCCQPDVEQCFENISALDCDEFDGEFIPDAVCALIGGAQTSGGGMLGVCATVTPTPEATETPTNTRIPDGGDCVDPDDCESGNCVDDVCCDTACEAPNQACNVPGLVGTCSDEIRAPAPTVSGIGLIVALFGLLAVGTFALSARRRRLEG